MGFCVDLYLVNRINLEFSKKRVKAKHPIILVSLFFLLQNSIYFSSKKQSNDNIVNFLIVFTNT